MQFLRRAYGHHLIFVHHAPAHGDPWLNVALGAAAIVTILGFAGGLYLAVRYGRRLSVSVTAEAYSTPSGVVLAVRPSVRAVGLFRVKLAKGTGATLKVTEMYIDNAPSLQGARHWIEADVYGDSYVEGGEDLRTTTNFLVPNPVDRVVGWRVSVEINIKKRILPGSSSGWGDQIFVPKAS